MYERVPRVAPLHIETISTTVRKLASYQHSPGLGWAGLGWAGLGWAGSSGMLGLLGNTAGGIERGTLEYRHLTYAWPSQSCFN